ncbi:tyrosine-type recombinase/integrase [Streptomyces sp. NBC_01431]|uniref:tyrosine-type recombinase/integrase n=1 Tax=Streptomyces sp. NBC_01431 TaxID=2903863 RepID=UPI002E3390FA|nr:tyrosine-type recombinase/integrase [Streptomyces sp. NBC_01431]
MRAHCCRPEEEAHPTRRLGRTTGLPRRPHHGWLFCTASGNRLDEPAVWRLLQSLAKRAGLTPRGPHGTKNDAITHALARPDARPDKIQRWADHRDFRTTQRYNKRKELLDDSPGYGLAADVAGAMEHGVPVRTVSPAANGGGQSSDLVGWGSSGVLVASASARRPPFSSGT